MSTITFRKRHSSARKRPSIHDLSSDLIPVTGKASFAIVIRNLLSPDECSFLIRRAEDEGFDHALIHGPDGKEVLNQTVRNCGRCIIDDEQLSNTIYQRILDALRGTVWEKKLQTLTIRKQHGGDSHTASAVGLNERMRFLKYEPGQFFAPHHDIRYVRGPEFGSRAGETSYVTVHIYLNEKVKGGSTRFLCGTRYYEVDPKVGNVLIFDHDLLHEGSKVTSGVKYSVRTDIMYKNSGVVEEKGVMGTPSTIGSDDGDAA